MEEINQMKEASSLRELATPIYRQVPPSGVYDMPFSKNFCRKVVVKIEKRQITKRKVVYSFLYLFLCLYFWWELFG